MSGEAPPAHSIETEQALLGSVLVNNRAFDYLEGLRPDHFYEPVHRVIFEGCQALVQAGKVASPLTLRTMLPADLKVADITSSQYLARLASEATSVINAKDYAGTLRALAQIRDMQSVLLDVSTHTDRRIFPGDAVREAYARLDTLRLDQPNQAQSETAAQSSAAFVNWMSGTMSGDIVEGGAPTGIADFDAMTGGFHGGNLIIVAGRPGTGKTTVATSVARAAARAGIGVLNFSLEMSDTQTMARLHCDEAFDEDPRDPITYNQALNPKRLLSMPHAERLMEASRRVSELPLMFDFSSNLTVGEIAAKARGAAIVIQRKFGRPLGLVIVDYLSFVRASDRYRGQRVYEVGEITASLKQLAKDLGVPIILLAQLSRAVEQTEHKIPDLSHLRDSGSIEQDADLVVFIYRRAYYLQNNPKTSDDMALQVELQHCINKLTLIVAKNRHGPTGNTEVFVHMGASAIRNLVREEREAEMFR